MTQTEIQTLLKSHALRHNWKMAMIGKNAHPCPVPDICGRTLYDAYLGKKIGAGSIAIIERFFANLPKGMSKDKQLANWIYYEEDDIFYCPECIDKRLEEANENKEFADEIDYEGGDTCNYMEDYAYEGAGEDVECCRCGAPLLSIDSDD